MTNGNLRYGIQSGANPGNNNNNAGPSVTSLAGAIPENLPMRQAVFKVVNSTNAAGDPQGGAIVGEVGIGGVQADAPAVEGYNGDGDGVQGTSGAHSGVVGIGPIGIRGVQDFAGGWAGAFNGRAYVEQDLIVVGNVDVFGTLLVRTQGGKHAAVRHPDGSTRLLYCLEGTEAWFEDFGRAELLDGQAEVELDADYAAIVEPDDYHVFLTPESDSNGLYVASKTSTGFRVREQQGGTGSFPFSYRVAARPKESSKQRLATLTQEETAPPEPFRLRQRQSDL
jgi:hypothetical protein